MSATPIIDDMAAWSKRIHEQLEHEVKSAASLLPLAETMFVGDDTIGASLINPGVAIIVDAIEELDSALVRAREKAAYLGAQIHSLSVAGY